MGAGGSSASDISPSHGVSINPRLQYANKKSRTKGEDVLIDAPSLVKLEHGTVRYRYVGEGNEVTDSRVEKPHEGPERTKKFGYFYHAKLKDFSDNADIDKEDSWKFCYVYKGAQGTRQKQLFYVFGKGLKTNEQGFIEPKYQGLDDVSSDMGPEKFYKIHGHMYYDLEYLPQKRELPQNMDEIQILGDGKVETDGNEVEIVVNKDDIVQRIKRKLAVKMFKPATHFHFYQHGEELDRDAVMSRFQPQTQTWTRFKILLKPKGPIDHRDVH